jgi:hypothetical protein
MNLVTDTIASYFLDWRPPFAVPPLPPGLNSGIAWRRDNHLLLGRHSQ